MTKVERKRGYAKAYPRETIETSWQEGEKEEIRIERSALEGRQAEAKEDDPLTRREQTPACRVSKRV